MCRKLKEIECFKLENFTSLLLHYIWSDLLMDYEKSEDEEILLQLVRVEGEIQRRVV